MYICDSDFLETFENSNDPDEYIVTVKDNKISILQLSDIHFNFNSDKDYKEELQEYIKKYSKNTELHGCLISGDILAANKLTEEFDIEKTENFEKIFNKYKIWHSNAANIIKNSLSECRSLGTTYKDRSLVVPGNHDVVRTAYAEEKGHNRTAHSFYQKFASDFIQNSYSPGEFESNDPVALSNHPKLSVFGNQNGIIAFLGLDSNQGTYNYGPEEFENYGLIEGEQLKGLKTVVSKLRNKFNDRPVYVIVVLHHHLLPVNNYARHKKDGDKINPNEDVSITLDSRRCIETFQDIKASLVLQGHMHKGVFKNVNYYNINREEVRDSLTIIGCNSYVHGKGCAVLDFDLYHGAGRVSIFGKCDEGKRADGKIIPFPLLSASRVSPGEMRVKQEITCWLSNQPILPTLPSGKKIGCSPNTENSKKYLKILEEEWEETGYTRLAGGIDQDNNEIKFPLEIDKCPPDSHKKYHLLLLLRKISGEKQILLSNHTPLRPSVFGSWDSLLLPAFRPDNIYDFFNSNVVSDFLRIKERYVHVTKLKEMNAIEKIERTIRKVINQLEKDELLELSDPKSFLGTKEFVKFSPTDGQPQVYEYSLLSLHWFALKNNCENSIYSLLNNLPETTAAEINNGAIRWEPDVENGTVEKLGPGLVWFPLADWKKCKSIIARNADVMQWVEAIIKKIDSGQLKYSMLGNLENIEQEQSIAITNIKSFEFESLKKKLKNVRCNPSLDLSEKYPYSRDDKIEQVILRKSENDTIRVFGLKNDDELGVLRPVQRYILKQGIKRIKELSEAIADYKIKDSEEKYDPCKLDGFLELELTGGMKISHLPPIIETIKKDEWHNDNDEEEFLVCDGTHRIIFHCWKNGTEIRAILIRNPEIDYYAYPIYKTDWIIIANNQYDMTPDLNSKYAPRIVPAEELKTLKDKYKYMVTSENAFRRYYRDFNTAFGSVGCQGGRLF